MMFRILAFLLLPVICLAQVNSKVEKPTSELLSIEISPNEMKRNASFNLEEIKVRWKKAALENCTGVPCVVTPPAPSFTCGTSTISDYEGNPYETVLIGTQCWTKQNLRVTKYNDGTTIPEITSTGAWNSIGTVARTVYNDLPANLSTYGYLYNWYAAAGIIIDGGLSTKNICPIGWHVPSDGEWITLIEFHGGILGNISTLINASAKMKQRGTTLWNNPNNGTDDFGFTALPGGQRYHSGFTGLKSETKFWSANGGILASYVWIESGPTGIYTENIERGFSIRCLRD
jgi:uncharacterized protein (TIGR02145 family)